MDTYQITAPPCLHWTDAIAAHLDPARHWRIYADGTWHPHTPPHTDHYFHAGDTHTGGGCLVLMATDEHWARGPIFVLPFTADGLSTDQGGSPALMELLAITGGLQALDHLHLSGTVLSDCQGLVRKLAHRHVLRRNPTSAGYPLMRDCARSITTARTLQWIKGHPERTRTPCSGWTQDQWGNYLADLYARSPASSPPLDFPSLVVIPPLSYTAFAQAAIRPQDWHFVAPDQAPLLAGLGSALAHASLVDYLHTRDACVPPAGHPPAGPALPSPARLRRGSSPNAGSPDAEARCVICGTCGGTAPNRPSPTPVSPGDMPLVWTRQLLANPYTM